MDLDFIGFYNTFRWLSSDYVRGDRSGIYTPLNYWTTSDVTYVDFGLPYRSVSSSSESWVSTGYAPANVPTSSS